MRWRSYGGTDEEREQALAVGSHHLRHSGTVGEGMIRESAGARDNGRQAIRFTPFSFTLAFASKTASVFSSL